MTTDHRTSFDLLLLGHLTRDEIAGEVRLGGGVSFAARAAAVLGMRVAMVTSAPPDSPLVAELRRTPGLTMHLVPSARPTTFALDYSGGRRVLRLLATAAELRAEDVPPAFRNSPVALVTPVAGECRGALVSSLRPAFVGVGLQGWLRRAGDGGRVEPAQLAEAVHPPAGIAVATLSEEDDPDAEGLAARLHTSGATVAITRGARGATLLAGDARLEVAAAPAVEVDPTGAGDVFGLVFTVALARGARPLQAAHAAAEAAARVVEGPGIGRLAAFDHRLLPPAR